ncbi:tRNA uridine-5-carboxymethylaminomethyl(34) synthesis GTPase MnmE [Terrihabitans rhizophilus]|uniref:tRNA modification GTPase MnmE n=1 Tax=Terrihabitans rhizophilus TaxID=3092662 RepID=A0ABU4RV47_9HYPH|nr:tRNA uridine-5-carboxymethylaminomethyl(34) synthesis GTPase MnmE [Terrihabitans sp. PJ23]MDX6807535.1 tRNA uridine-5-carboxymethylaminomethyl(34) synthesis GTPase MnmE [Terrihabitans sp. PJ23]
MMTDDTIFALSTAPGRAGVAVVRVSGRLASEAAVQLAGQCPPPRVATLRTLREFSGEVLDRGLVIYFPRPNSFTGQDVVEFHLHGGRAILKGVIGVLASMSGLRPAEAGEFVRRAVEAGKMDLSEAEALADLLDSETGAQRRQALQGLGGGIGRKADHWRAMLIDALALVEAAIDFSEEEDIGTGLIDRAASDSRALLREMNLVLAAPDGERLRDGATIIVAGPPNAGKSTFINAVAGRDVALATPHAGTTRDMIEVMLDLGGYPAVLVDTAGFRETSDPVEREAIRRARLRAEKADLVLWLSDDAAIGPPDLGGTTVWQVHTKADLLGPDAAAGFVISAVSGHGIPDLLGAMEAWAKKLLVGAESALITRARHRDALRDATGYLEAAIDLVEPELMAENLRLAARALGRISGRVDVEDVLDKIFGQFCIGK